MGVRGPDNRLTGGPGAGPAESDSRPALIDRPNDAGSVRPTLSDVPTFGQSSPNVANVRIAPTWHILTVHAAEGLRGSAVPATARGSGMCADQSGGGV